MRINGKPKALDSLKEGEGEVPLSTYIEAVPVSRSACNLHLINSVGQRVKEEKKAAKKPETKGGKERKS